MLLSYPSGVIVNLELVFASLIQMRNANLTMQCLWCLLEILGLQLCIRKKNNGAKTREKHNSASSNEG